MSGKTGVASSCSICGEAYVGLALDCACTVEAHGVLDALDVKLKKIPAGEGLPILGVDQPLLAVDPSNRLIQNRMAIANSVEDLAWGYVHAYVSMLRERGLLTEAQILDTLGALDESLQTPNTA